MPEQGAAAACWVDHSRCTHHVHPKCVVGGVTVRAYGNLTDRILAILQEHGPSTAADVYMEMPETPRNHIRMTLGRLTAACMHGPHAGTRRAHIQAWVYDAENARSYPRPLYALGNKPDAPKPKPRSTTKAAARVYRSKYRNMVTRNSVFNLGGLVCQSNTN